MNFSLKMFPALVTVGVGVGVEFVVVRVCGWLGV